MKVDTEWSPALEFSQAQPCKGSVLVFSALDVYCSCSRSGSNRRILFLFSGSFKSSARRRLTASPGPGDELDSRLDIRSIIGLNRLIFVLGKGSVPASSVFKPFGTTLIPSAS